jgi:REP element-mobilizing transposase RayT
LTAVFDPVFDAPLLGSFAMTFLHTTRFTRGKLPHWEVENGRYFVTVRLADSIPRASVLRLQEIHHSLAAVEAQSAAFVGLQRQYFLTMEKYLDAGAGECFLRQSAHAMVIVEELASLTDWNVEVPHYTIMPNHWHALITTKPESTGSLAEIMKRLKGRTGKRLRSAVVGSGPIWQREWFDRWIRTDAEWEKMVAYIQNNPVKAGICSRLHEHPWTK